MHHKTIELLILLHLRADLLCTLQYETPCTFLKNIKYRSHALKNHSNLEASEFFEYKRFNEFMYQDLLKKSWNIGGPHIL